MNPVYAGMLSVLLIVSSGSARGQGPGQFTLSVPGSSLQLNQGESRAIYVAISRGKNFVDNVTVRFENVPAGLVIDPYVAVITPDNNSLKLSVTANGARVGSYQIRAVGRPQRGVEGWTTFTVDVSR